MVQVYANMHYLESYLKVKTVFTVPRNDGTENNVPISADDFDGLTVFAQKNNCFTVF